MADIRALQLGTEDYARRATLGEDVAWSFEPELDEATREYDVAFVSRPLVADEARWLERHVRAYCLFVSRDLALDAPMRHLVRSRRARLFSEDDVRRILEKDLRNYYSKPYGEKFDPHMLAVSPGFRGDVSWDGGVGAILSGGFGERMGQVAFWRSNIPVEPGQALDLWLEYEKDGGVEVELETVQFVRGSISSVQDVRRFS